MSTTYRSTVDRAAEVRAALKSKGITSRQVSVRGEYFSMGSEIRVSIKDPSVKAGEVRRIAEQHERIDYCAITGETLSGANRFVSVTYSSEAQDAMTLPLVAPVEAALARLTDTTHLEPVAGTSYLVGRPRDWCVTVWDSRRQRMINDMCHDAQSAAYAIALDQRDPRR